MGKEDKISYGGAVLFQKKYMEELNTFNQAENIVYSTNDGLVHKRKRRIIMIV